jgi:hypothetical protein
VSLERTEDKHIGLFYDAIYKLKKSNLIRLENDKLLVGVNARRSCCDITYNNILTLPVPVAARSKAWVCGRSPAEIVGSNDTGGMDVCRIFSVRDLCDELITRPEDSYRLWCVVVCDLEIS